MDDTHAERSESGGLLALALWIGIVLCVLRAAIAFGMDHVAHGMDRPTSLWRVARLLGPTLLGVGATAGVLMVLVSRAGRPGRLGAGGMLALLASAAIAFVVLAGFGVDVPSRVPDLSGGSGFLAFLVLAGLSVVVAGAGLLATRARPRFSRGRLAPIAAVVAGVALWLGPEALGIGPSPMRVREVVRALLEEPEHLTVTCENPGREPHVDAITAVTHWRTRGGERPALVMPPGCEVRFEIPPELGPVRLRTAAGIDQSLLAKASPSRDAVRFRFEVLVDDAPVFDKVITLDSERDKLEFGWRPVGGDAGLALEPGNVVTLRTSVNKARSRPHALLYRIGFSDLLLERDRERQRELSSPDAPNIVLVLMDTLRRDRLGTYGNPRGLTPNLDALAERGIVHEKAFAPSSWTWPSTASVLTGLEPETHGVLDDSSCHVARGIELLSEALQRRGYTTAAFSASPLIVPDKSFDQGFEFYDADARGFRKSDMIVPPAIEWVRTFAGQRFFLYIHLADTHDPHRPLAELRDRFAGDPPKGFDRGTFTGYTKRLRDGEAYADDGGSWDVSSIVPPEHRRYLDLVYDACVATGDHWVGELLDGLAGAGILDETVVAFTSDHGEEFFEHGFLEHGHSLHPELVGVPLILAGPGVASGARSTASVSNRHLAPTLARLGGTRLAAVEDAIDLARPEERELAPIVLGTHFGWWNQWHRTPIHGLRAGRWVLHWAPEAGDWGAEEPTPGGQWRLYDVERDPDELVDLAALEPERAEEMLAELRRRLEELTARRSSPAIGGAGTRELLEGIGYLDSGE